MDAGRYSHFNQRVSHNKFAGSGKQKIRSADKQQPRGSIEHTVNKLATDNSSSSHQIPRSVKSLVSGRVLHPRPGRAATREIDSIGERLSHTMPPPQQCITERVVIDSNFRQNSPPNKNKQKSRTATSPTSPAGFFASIGACASAGVASFLNEHNEETTVEYHYDGVNNIKDEQRGHGNGVYNCYGSPTNCTKTSDDNKEEAMMVRFSKDPVPLTSSRSAVTARDSAMMLKSESLGGGISSDGAVRLNRATTSYDAFSSARRLLFGEEEPSKVTMPTTQSSPFQCKNDSNAVCGTSDDTVNTSFIRWYSEELPVFPSADKSMECSSFAPSKTIYAAAYDDDNTTYNTKNIDDVPLDLSAILRSEVRESQNEIRYWRQRLQYAKKHYGNVHSSTADAYFNLGRAQMNLSPNNSTQNREACFDSNGLPSRHRKEAPIQQQHRYDLAIDNLTIAHGIWERRHGPEHLAVGRALDSLALAIVKRANHNRATSGASRTAIKEDMQYARRLLEQAFSVRVHHLGVWHVDTVETYNKLAGVLLHLGLLSDACKAYREVFLVRRAIFGNRHPSVAISAHAIANVHYKRGNIKDSLAWYEASLEIYEGMGLSYRHPAVSQLLKDQSRLEKYMNLQV